MRVKEGRVGVSMFFRRRLKSTYKEEGTLGRVAPPTYGAPTTGVRCRGQVALGTLVSNVFVSGSRSTREYKTSLVPSHRLAL